MDRRVLLLALIASLLSPSAVAWDSQGFDVGASKTVNLRVGLKDESVGGVWRSGSLPSLSGAEAVSANLVGNFSSLGDLTLHVFDEDGVIAESVHLPDVTGNSFWTELVPGRTLQLEVHGKPISWETFEIKEIASPTPAGTGDIVADGKPAFLTSEDITDGEPPVAAQYAIARLIVGQNRVPLGSRSPSKTPDWCTGFLVSKNLLMTASHCLKPRPKLCEQTVALFGYGLDSSEPLIARRCEELVYLNRYLDVAVVRLTALQDSFQHIELADRPPAASEALIIIQHPRGAIRLISRDDQCKVVAQQSALDPSHKDLDVALLTALGFAHKCDTLNGSSGAPVLGQDGKVIGVHQGASYGSNKAVRSDVVLSCIAIDAHGDQIKVLKELKSCQNTLP